MHRHSGFTLIEMAIVIIIGLLAGGVVQGIGLLQQTEMRRVAEDIQSYRQAVSLFKDKYEFYPGDMPNATLIWGRADGGADLTQNCAAPETDSDAANPKATCNGDGDGNIALTGGTTHNTEAYRLWQHLSNAGLIGGTYTGVGGTFNMGTGWRAATPGLNVPEAPIKNAGYFIHRTRQSAFGMPGQKWTGLDANKYSNWVTLGGRSATGWPWEKILTPEDVQALDIKLDNGRPGSGIVIVMPATVCTDITDTSTAVYLTNVTDTVCNPIARVD